MQQTVFVLQQNTFNLIEKDNNSDVTNDIQKGELKSVYYKLMYQKKEKAPSVAAHGSLPLMLLCCSSRLLRSVSVCLARSQVSLDRDVCPRLRDNSLWTYSQSAPPFEQASVWININGQGHFLIRFISDKLQT